MGIGWMEPGGLYRFTTMLVTIFQVLKDLTAAVQPANVPLRVVFVNIRIICFGGSVLQLYLFVH